MAMSRSTGALIACVFGLSVACIGLLVALLVSQSNLNEQSSQLQSNGVKKPGVPIVNPSIDDDYFEPIEEPNDDYWDLAENTEDESNTLKFPWETQVRLPRNILPLHYDLSLFPDLKDGVFSGKVQIEVESREPTDYFLAHVKYLDIEMAKLTRNGIEIDLMEAMEYKPNEFFVMRTSQIAPPGKYVMHFGKKFIF